MIMIKEENGELILEFHEPKMLDDPARLSVETVVSKRINLSEHIGRACIEAFRHEIDRKVELERKELGEELAAIVEKDYSRFR